jgi:small acid-soluble spore protein (thioredoxin-like protein)
MKNKPDDRSDNAEKIKKNIDMTLRNMELADEMIARTPDSKMKKALGEKNVRREQALEAMRREIREESTQRNKPQ